MPPQITRERLNFSMNRKVKWRILSKKFDKFGRMYVVWLDRNNMEPTGQVERAFSVPLDDEGRAVDIPDIFDNGQRGLTFPEDKPWRVALALEAYARYLKRALAEWEFRYKEIRGARPKDEPEERALQMVGPKPQDWRLIVLLSRGDQWCLGKTTRRTAAVEAIIGKAPTARQLRIERERPKDLRLPDDIEALIGQGVDSSFPDELDDRLEREDLTVDQDDLEQAGIELTDPRLGPEDDDEEEVLTGSEVDLMQFDDPDLDDDEDDLAAELEEKIDPHAIGGKRVKPAKNRTRPAKE